MQLFSLFSLASSSSARLFSIELRGNGCILELTENKSGLLLTEKQLSGGCKHIYICIGVKLYSCVCVRPNVMKSFSRLNYE